MKQTTTNEKKTFADTLHEFEIAYFKGDYAAELQELSNAIAHAVLNKCLDPQRKTAAERQTVSNNGINPAMRSLKIGLTADGHLLENTRHAVNAATYSHLNADGEMVTETADHDALEAAAVLCSEALSDGIDLAQEIAVAILEQADKYGPIPCDLDSYAEKILIDTENAAYFSGDKETAAKLHYAYYDIVCGDKTNAERIAIGKKYGVDIVPHWMETPYTVSRLSRRVLIKEQTAAWKEETTTPVQEVYRAARRYIQNSRAAQTDPRNGYSYIEDFATDEQGGMEVIYHRLNKWADLGGADCYGHYTADTQTAIDYYTIMERLNLTEKQTRIVDLRMRGYGYKAIATACGVTQRAVAHTLERVQAKCTEIGFTPYAHAVLNADR